MITSAQNAKLKLVRALLGRPKERREAGAFLAEGVRLVEEAVTAKWPVRFVLYGGELSRRGVDLVEKCRVEKVELEEVSETILRSLSETETSQGILAVLDDSQLMIPEPPDFVLVPDQIRDPGNLGTLLRSALAAGVQAVLIPPETTDAFSPKAVRSGMGAHFRLPIRTMGWNDIGKQTKGLQVLIADMDGKSCWETDLRQPLVLIVGSEAGGVSESARAVAGGRISIPMRGGVESLNAGAAGSVLMFEVMRQRSQK